MSAKQCEKCGETVSEAKAFCPSCGHAFVEEETRSEKSAFESMDGTMQFGKTMYNQMLSDMGLSVQPQPAKSAERIVEPIQPVAPPPPKRTEQVLQPAAPAPTSVPKTSPTNTTPWKKWLIVGIIAVFLLFLLLAVVLVAGYFFYLRSGQF